MSAEREARAGLGREGLFVLLCEETLRDGRVCARDNRVLNAFMHHLDLDPARAAVVMRRAVGRQADRRQADHGGAPRPFDPRAIYRRAARLALLEPSVSPEDLELLELVRRVFRISETLDRGMLEMVERAPATDRSPAPSARLMAPENRGASGRPPLAPAPAPAPAHVTTVGSPTTTGLRPWQGMAGVGVVFAVLSFVNLIVSMTDGLPFFVYPVFLSMSAFAMAAHEHMNERTSTP